MWNPKTPQFLTKEARAALTETKEAVSVANLGIAFYNSRNHGVSIGVASIVGVDGALAGVIDAVSLGGVGVAASAAKVPYQAGKSMISAGMLGDVAAGALNIVDC